VLAQSALFAVTILLFAEGQWIGALMPLALLLALTAFHFEAFNL